jgi:hypothetical protein
MMNIQAEKNTRNEAKLDFWALVSVSVGKKTKNMSYF